jgi:hypothetical protein
MSQLCLFDVALVSEAGSQTPAVDLRAVLSKPTVTALLGLTWYHSSFRYQMDTAPPVNVNS